MRPLSIALIHRDSSRCLDYQRMYGEFSYPVPEFTWRHYPARKGQTFDKNLLAVRHDAIYVEDGKLAIHFKGDGEIPIFYRVMDSTLSVAHYQHRSGQAREYADVILVDWDRLERFEGLGARVERYSYCVNDHLFLDYGMARDIDVGFFCHLYPTLDEDRDRDWVNQSLAEASRVHVWNYQSGVLQGRHYAHAFNRCKILVNVCRTPDTRSCRVFDAMAARTCLVTKHLPVIKGELRDPGVHYVEFDTMSGCIAIIEQLLESGKWQEIADAGHEMTMRHHAWHVRARELRALIEEAIG